MEKTGSLKSDTALSNGAVSALISFVRSLVLRGGLVMILPIALGLDGVWLSVALAETLGACLAIFLFVRYHKRYHYW